jgi:hypothetical protein
MSSIQAPSWAFIAEAIDGVSDTHLPMGVHVRALPSPRLGLPATPLVVYRSVLDRAMIKALGRTDGVTWIDSHGATVSLPFNVTPENPVYGYFPAPDVFFAELTATPARGFAIGPIGPIRDRGLATASQTATAGPTTTTPLTNAAASRNSNRMVGPVAAAKDPRAFLPRLRDVLVGAARYLVDLLARLVRLLLDLLARLFRPPGSITFEALANTGLGVAPLQSRSRAPYTLASWTIPLVRVSGRGSVQGINWIDATRLRETKGETLWEAWSLPVKPAPRYAPTPNAAVESAARVERAGVTHQPLYVAYAVASPSAAPPTAPGDATARVAQVRSNLNGWLGTLLNDLSSETWELVDTQAIDGTDGKIAIPMEPFLLAGAVDPDVGHYLGFGDVDEPAAQGSLVLYRVRGLWRWKDGRWSPSEARSFRTAVRPDLATALAGFPDLQSLGISPREEGPFVDLHAMAVALVGTPPDVPPAISFDATEDRGWLATPPPPDVRRALRLLASSFRPHAVAALAATDSRGQRTLHSFPGGGRIVIGQPIPAGTPLPLVVTRPADAVNPGEGRFEDRDAPEGAVEYKLAQGDWFGRWSGWQTRTAPAKARTGPMRPTIEIYPQPPTVASPVPGGLLHGTIQLRIPIPKTPDLPAGGAALARLELDETFDGSPTVTTSFNLASPSPATIETYVDPAQDLLLIVRNGPDLPRCGSRKVTYTARWVDSLGHVSPNADPAARTMVDPRPPEPPPVITSLRWTARPDAEGHARVDLDFNSTVGTRYRVFATNETILLKALLDGGQIAARSDILSAVPGAPRAGKFRDHKALFGWAHFESLTKQPIVATSTTTHFVHRLSGSLEVLAIYRVLGEGPSGVLSEITEADLVPFAVPNLGGPSRPQIAVLNKELDPTTSGVCLRVKVPRGKAAPKNWRLRRASVPTPDPLAMQLVDQAAVTGATVDGEGTTFEIRATAPLRPWRQYRFAVEVQADDPPGSPTVGIILPGEWSEASAPATVAVIPPNAPAPPSAVVIANVVGGLQITISHPAAASLIGTALGPHRFEIWRVEPTGRPVKRDVAFSLSGTTWTGTDTGPAPAGTYVTVRIIDPAGRSGTATPSNQI